MQEDKCFERSLFQKLTWDAIQYFGEPILNSWAFKIIRNRALQIAKCHIDYEDHNRVEKVNFILLFSFIIIIIDNNLILINII